MFVKVAAGHTIMKEVVNGLTVDREFYGPGKIVEILPDADAAQLIADGEGTDNGVGPEDPYDRVQTVDNKNFGRANEARPLPPHNVSGVLTNDGNGNLTWEAAGTGTGTGNTSVVTDNGDGTYTHDDGTGTTVVIDTNGSETVTSLALAGNTLTYTDETGTPTALDLSLYLDDTNLARITAGTLDGVTGIATFTRDDASTFTLDLSNLLPVTFADATTAADDATGDGGVATDAARADHKHAAQSVSTDIGNALYNGTDGLAMLDADSMNNVTVSDEASAIAAAPVGQPAFSYDGDLHIEKYTDVTGIWEYSGGTWTLAAQIDPDEVMSFTAEPSGAAQAGAQFGIKTDTGALFYVDGSGNWQPIVSADTLYSADGVLAGNRIVDGTDPSVIGLYNSMSFENINSFSANIATATGNFNIDADRTSFEHSFQNGTIEARVDGSVASGFAELVYIDTAGYGTSMVQLTDTQARIDAGGSKYILGDGAGTRLPADVAAETTKSLVVDTATGNLLLETAATASANARVFASDSVISPAIAGAPTAAEVNASVANLDTFIYYTGTDVSTDPITYVFYSDGVGDVTLLQEPAVASVVPDRVFADDTTVAPAATGAPTETEISAFATAGGYTDTVIYYTGTNLATDAVSYVFHVDGSGNVTEVQSQAGGVSTDLDNRISVGTDLGAYIENGMNSNLANGNFSTGWSRNSGGQYNGYSGTGGHHVTITNPANFDNSNLVDRTYVPNNGTADLDVVANTGVTYSGPSVIGAGQCLVLFARPALGTVYGHLLLDDDIGTVQDAVVLLGEYGGTPSANDVLGAAQTVTLLNNGVTWNDLIASADYDEYRVDVSYSGGTAWSNAGTHFFKPVDIIDGNGFFHTTDSAGNWGIAPYINGLATGDITLSGDADWAGALIRIYGIRKSKTVIRNETKTFSTTEQITDLTWIDGKPIYETTIDLNGVADGATLLTGIETLVDVSGAAFVAADDIRQIPHYYSPNNVVLYVMLTPSTNTLTWHSSFATQASGANLTLRYTKV